MALCYRLGGPDLGETSSGLTCHVATLCDMHQCVFCLCKAVLQSWADAVMSFLVN